MTRLTCPGPGSWTFWVQAAESVGEAPVSNSVTCAITSTALPCVCNAPPLQMAEGAAQLVQAVPVTPGQSIAAAPVPDVPTPAARPPVPSAPVPTPTVAAVQKVPVQRTLAPVMLTPFPVSPPLLPVVPVAPVMPVVPVTQAQALETQAPAQPDAVTKRPHRRAHRRHHHRAQR
jgi:hypothetical protein